MPAQCKYIKQGQKCPYGKKCKFQHNGSDRFDKLRSSAPAQLLEFFEKYGFDDYDPTEPATHEFNKMCRRFQWKKGDADREEAYDEFQDVLTMQFNETYGTDANDLDSWQNLCTRIGIVPVPDDIKGCRKVISGTHVNLVDLVSNKRRVRRFRTVQALSEYTKEMGKFFPKENANAGNLLKYLLRQILNPN